MKTQKTKRRAYMCDGCGRPIDPATQDYAGERPGAAPVREHADDEHDDCKAPHRERFTWTMFTHDDPRPWHTEAAGH